MDKENSSVVFSLPNGPLKDSVLSNMSNIPLPRKALGILNRKTSDSKSLKTGKIIVKTDTTTSTKLETGCSSSQKCRVPVFHDGPAQNDPESKHLFKPTEKNTTTTAKLETGCSSSQKCRVPVFNDEPAQNDPESKYLFKPTEKNTTTTAKLETGCSTSQKCRVPVCNDEPAQNDQESKHLFKPTEKVIRKIRNLIGHGDNDEIEYMPPADDYKDDYKYCLPESDRISREDFIKFYTWQPQNNPKLPSPPPEFINFDWPLLASMPQNSPNLNEMFLPKLNCSVPSNDSIGSSFKVNLEDMFLPEFEVSVSSLDLNSSFED